MPDRELTKAVNPEIMGDDEPMPEVLSDEDREYFEPFECPEDLDFYEPQKRPTSPIDNPVADKAYSAALKKKETEPGIEALKEALNIRDKREKKHDRGDWNDFAGYLNSIKEEIGFRVFASKHQVFEIGRLIYEARTFVSNWCFGKSKERQIQAKGYFSQWLDDNFPVSRQSVLNCVRVYKACLGFEENVKFFQASTLYLMSEPRFRKDVRQYLLENVNNTFKGKRAELLEIAAKLHSGEISYDGPEMRKMLRNNVEHTVATNIVREFAGIEKALVSHRKSLENRQSRSVAEPLVPVKEGGKGHVLYKEAIELIDGLLKTVQDKKIELQEAEGLPK